MSRLACLALLASPALLLACEPDRAAVRSDGTLAIGSRGAMLVANFDQEWRREIPMPSREDAACSPLWPAWSADGRHLAFVCWSDSLGVADVESGLVRVFESKKLHPEYDEIYLPQWSPKARTVTYVAYTEDEDGERSELHAAALADDLSLEEHRVLSADMPSSVVHAWFPDGKSIALVVSGQPSPDIESELAVGYVGRLRLESGEIERLAAVPFLGVHMIEVVGRGSQILFSATGKSLPSVSFGSDKDLAPFSLWRLELAPRVLTRITRDGEPSWYFAASPSGRRVLYVRGRSGQLLDSDGPFYVWGEGVAGHREVRDQDEDGFLPVWLDEHRIVYGNDGHAHVVDLRSNKSEDVTERLVGKRELEPAG